MSSGLPAASVTAHLNFKNGEGEIQIITFYIFSDKAASQVTDENGGLPAIWLTEHGKAQIYLLLGLLSELNCNIVVFFLVSFIAQNLASNIILIL